MATTDYEPLKRTLGQLLIEATDKPIVVPDYQRDFSWSRSEAETLWVDLKQFSGQYPGEQIAGQMYFLGTMVMVAKPTEDELLDGQQRLATATILLSVIRDRLEAFDKAAASRTEARYIRDTDDATGRIVHKLTLNAYDRDYFRQLVQSAPGGVDPIASRESHRLIREVRDFFRGQFDAEYGKRSPNEAHEWAIRIMRVLTGNMSLVAVSSTDEDNASAIFETLNDRGIGLDTADLVKSFLLRQAAPSDRPTVVSLWGEASRMDGVGRFDDLLRFYWVTQEGDVKQRSLYRDIKDKFTQRKLKAVGLSQALSQASVEYQEILEARDPDDDVAWVFESAREMNARALYPAFLAAEGLTTNRLKFVRALLNVFVRHTVIGGLSNSTLESVVYGIAHRVKRDSHVGPELAMMRQFAPSDQAFEEAFRRRSIRHVATARYLLKELESKLRKTTELRVAGAKKVHLEHIYPQRPGAGAGWPDHDEWVSRIGNLTLLDKALNQRARNADFATKKAHYVNSQLELTKALLPLSAWETAAIDQRQDELAKLAASIWPI